MVPFTIFPLTLISEKGQDINNNYIHRQNAKIWLRYGILLLSDRKGEESFRKVLKKINSVDAQKVWAEAYRQAKLHKRIVFLNEPHQWESIEDIIADSDLQDILRLVCCHEDNVKNFCNEVDTSKIGICTFEDLNFSRFFGECIDNLLRQCNKGEKRDEIWERHFKFFARYSKDIKIIDRFLIKEVCEDNLSSLDYFLEKLSNENNVGNISEKKITILSQQRRKINPSKDLDKIKKICNSHNFTSGEIISCSDKFFKIFAHDRFVVFDDDVCQIGRGLSIFSSDTLHENSVFSWKRDSRRDYMTVIKQLRRDPQKQIRKLKTNNFQ
jgi:hypothetical protein